MATTNHAFGIFGAPEEVDKVVDALIDSGIDRSDIVVLYPDNQSSRAFADRKKTTAPWGTDRGPTAEMTLGGSLGIADPEAGPQEGALVPAMAQMGIPPTFAEGALTQGKVLLSVECETPEGTRRVAEQLRRSGAEDVGFALNQDQTPTLQMHNGVRRTTASVVPPPGSIIGEDTTPDFRQFDLPEQAASSAGKHNDVDTRDLFKEHGFRVRLVTMQRGARMLDHRLEGANTLQVLRGHIRYVTSERMIYELKSGGLMAMAGAGYIEVEALEETALLLTISWQDDTYSRS